MQIKIIQKIVVSVGLLLYATTALGKHDTKLPELDTLSVEEQQQFLY